MPEQRSDLASSSQETSCPQGSRDLANPRVLLPSVLRDALHVCVYTESWKISFIVKILWFCGQSG